MIRAGAGGKVGEKRGGTTGRRLALAEWLTAPGSAQASLLARVTVNRMWQHYFGVGLVSTPDNLGLSGARPTHPELLDELAGRFVAAGWSQKEVHRWILGSRVFRQTSAPRARGVAGDPDNRWLWRYPVRRLDAEAIWDGMLAVSGRLGAKTGGPYVPTPRAGSGEVLVDEGHPEAFSRAVFLQHRRTQVPTFLGTFDAPSVVFSCARRATTTMPLQSLTLLNSDVAVKRGADLAARVCREIDGNGEAGAGGEEKLDAARLSRAFWLVAGREPTRAERRAALRFLGEQRMVYAGLPGVEPNVRAWADLGQSLLAMNAFLYVE